MSTIPETTTTTTTVAAPMTTTEQLILGMPVWGFVVFLILLILLISCMGALVWLIYDCYKECKKWKKEKEAAKAAPNQVAATQPAPSLGQPQVAVPPPESRTSNEPPSSAAPVAPPLPPPKDPAPVVALMPTTVAVAPAESRPFVLVNPQTNASHMDVSAKNFLSQRDATTRPQESSKEPSKKLQPGGDVSTRNPSNVFDANSKVTNV